MKKIKVFVALLATVITGQMYGQTITANDVNISKGSTSEVTFSINSDKVAAIAEFKLPLPEGITVAYDENNGEKIYKVAVVDDMMQESSSHTVFVKQRDNGDYYVLVYNPNAKEFAAASGAFLKLTLLADKNATSGVATMKEIVLGSLDAKQLNTDTGANFNIEVGPAKGDANGDGSVDVADADFVIEVIGGTYLKDADVNGDGDVDVADVDFIIELI